MKNLRRVLLVGAVWGAIFIAWWINSFLVQNWNFKLYSPHSWQTFYHRFMDGWEIKSTSDWILVWVLVLMIPAYIVGWYLCLKVRWRKTVFGNAKKVWHMTPVGKPRLTKRKMKHLKKASHHKVRPKPLYTTLKTLESDKSKLGKTTSQPQYMPDRKVSTPGGSVPTFDDGALLSGGYATSSNMAGTRSAAAPSDADNFMPDFLKDANLDAISLDDVQLPERTALNEDMPAILLRAGYKVVADILLDKMTINYAAIDSDSIYLIKTDTEAGDWLADEERFNDQDPLWFSESSHRVSPIYELKQEADAFQNRLMKKGLSHKVKCVLVEMAGDIVNAEDMQSTWSAMSVTVVRSGMGGPEELPSFESGMPHASGEPVSAETVSLIQNTF